MLMVGREHGLLIRPIGRSIYVMPPFVLDAPWWHFLQQALQQSLDLALGKPQSGDIKNSSYLGRFGADFCGFQQFFYGSDVFAKLA